MLSRALTSARPSPSPSLRRCPSTSSSTSILAHPPRHTRLFNSTPPIVETDNSSSPSSTFDIPPLTTPTTSPSEPHTTPPTTTLHPSIPSLLPLLLAQPPHYITAHIHARPYLLTAGDTLRLPFHMPGVLPGDILRLNRASALGSRDYTLRGAPYLDERLFEVRARVLGVESEPMRVKEKTKRRNRKVKTVRSKHRFTVLRVAEVRVRGVAEVERMEEVGMTVEDGEEAL
ncbi:MAG: hypothetical protein M1817_002485 [Caeruleum heppii]|nr:MAG: hypothetical protein M1817_002485 [Caeruleum heppii]